MEKKKYPRDFRKNAVELLLTSGKTQRVLCDELGVTYGLIGKWRKEFDLGRPENSDMKAAVDARVIALEKEVATLRQERDILKKAMGIALKI